MDLVRISRAEFCREADVAGAWYVSGDMLDPLREIAQGQTDAHSRIRVLITGRTVASSALAFRRKDKRNAPGHLSVAGFQKERGTPRAT